MDSRWNVLVERCPARSSLVGIANRWTALVVIALAAGPLRFGVLQRTVEGVSAKVLAGTLRTLERDGLVSRSEHPGVPPRVDYELTELGRSLHAPLRALADWAEAHLDEVAAARAAYDARP